MMLLDMIAKNYSIITEAKFDTTIDIGRYKYSEHVKIVRVFIMVKKS